MAKKYKTIGPDVFRSATSISLADVVTAVKGAANRGRLDVRGTMGITEAVSKFDVLSFTDNSILMLEALDAPFIALAAETLILDIQNPLYKAYLSRPVGSQEAKILATLSGFDAGPGRDGGNGVGNGNPGHPGTGGGDGGHARTLQMPPIFLFFQQFKFGKATTPLRQYFNFVFNGIPGGSGGLGGNGGNGGKGAAGQDAVPGFPDCKAGAGNGGRGGAAGSGGRGGDAAIGGDGAFVEIYAPVISILDYSTTDIEGGPPGQPGKPGQEGSPGTGGPGGKAKGNCFGSGSRGPMGPYANPRNFGMGNYQWPGSRGQLQIITRNNVDLF